MASPEAPSGEATAASSGPPAGSDAGAGGGSSGESSSGEDEVEVRLEAAPGAEAAAPAGAGPAAAATGGEEEDAGGLGLYEETLDLYELGNYTFGRKDVESGGILERGASPGELEAHWRERYEKNGMRRTVAGVLLVYSHRFPHILLLQRADGTGPYFLPGGKLHPGESDEDGLKRKLTSKLSPLPLPTATASTPPAPSPSWEIGDQLCSWWSIDFSGRKYPYVPAHVTKPKEQLKVFLVALPEKCVFAVPKNLQLVAVPLFELFGQTTDYGPVISSVPALLAKYHINYLS